MWRDIDEAIASIRSGPAPKVPVAVAVTASAGAVVAGNAVVLLQRRLGGTAGELLTTVAHPLLGLAGASVLIGAGWRRRDVGLSLPSGGTLASVRRPALAVAWALGVAVVATWIRGGTHDGVSDRVTVLRLMIGTALGEELIHRAVLFPLWAATGRPSRDVGVANGVAFGAWHLAAVAPKGWGGRIAGILGPAVPGTALFLWGRCRSGSVVGSWLLHVATNLPGVVARAWSKPV